MNRKRDSRSSEKWLHPPLPTDLLPPLEVREEAPPWGISKLGPGLHAKGILDCSQFLTLNYAALEDLKDTPLDNPDMEIFTDGSSFVREELKSLFHFHQEAF